MKGNSERKTVNNWEKWRNIHSEFSEEQIVDLWTKNGFIYEQTQDWASAFGNIFSPSQHHVIVHWMHNIRKLTPEEVLDGEAGFIEELFQECEKYLEEMEINDSSEEKLEEIFPEQEEISEELGGLLSLLAQRVPQITKEQEILTGLVSFHQEQLKIREEKLKNQKRKHEQEKWDLGNEKEKINVKLGQKFEELKNLQIELSKEKAISGKLSEEIEEERKSFQVESERLNDLVNQENAKLKLSVSKSTLAREGSSKKKLEEELVNLKANSAKEKGDFEKSIVKLEGEKTKVEKRVEGLENLINIDQEKKNLKSEVERLNEELSKVIEDRNFYQEKNRKLTENIRRGGSFSSNSLIGSTNNSSNSSPVSSRRPTFSLLSSKVKEMVKPNHKKGKKEERKGENFLADELNKALKGIIQDDSSSFSNDNDETSSVSDSGKGVKKWLKNTSSVLDDPQFTSYVTTPVDSESGSIHDLERVYTQETIKAQALTIGEAEKLDIASEKVNVDEVIANDYKQVKEELEAARKKLQHLERENDHQLNFLKERDEEIQKLRSPEKHQNLKRSSSFSSLKFLGKSAEKIEKTITRKPSKKDLVDKISILQAENSILADERLKAEYETLREKEKSENFENKLLEEEKEIRKLVIEWEKKLEGNKSKSAVLIVVEKLDEKIIGEKDPAKRTYIRVIGGEEADEKKEKRLSVLVDQWLNESEKGEIITEDIYTYEQSEKFKINKVKPDLVSVDEEVNQLKETVENYQVEIKKLISQLDLKDKTILELKKGRISEGIEDNGINMTQEQNDWTTSSSLGSPMDSFFSCHSRDESRGSVGSFSSITSGSSLASISILKTRITRLESENNLLKNENDKNELEIEEKYQELSELKTSLLQYLKKQVIFVSKLEEKRSKLGLLEVPNGIFQDDITTLLSEIDSSLEKVKSDWKDIRKGVEFEEIFPKDWEEACSVFFEFDSIGLTSDDEDLSDSEIDPKLREIEEKLNKVLNFGKSALGEKLVSSQSPIKENAELEEREKKFDEEIWKSGEQILEKQVDIDDELNKLCESAEEYEQKEFIWGQDSESQRSRIFWEILDLQIQLEEELRDIDGKKEISEEKIRTLEEIVFLLKTVGRKIGIESEKIEAKIFQIASETIQDQELFGQLLIAYNNYHRKVYDDKLRKGWSIKVSNPDSYKIEELENQLVTAQQFIQKKETELLLMQAQKDEIHANLDLIFADLNREKEKNSNLQKLLNNFEITVNKPSLSNKEKESSSTTNYWTTFLKNLDQQTVNKVKMHLVENKKNYKNAAVIGLTMSGISASFYRNSATPNNLSNELIRCDMMLSDAFNQRNIWEQKNSQLENYLTGNQTYWAEQEISWKINYQSELGQLNKRDVNNKLAEENTDLITKLQVAENQLTITNWKLKELTINLTQQEQNWQKKLKNEKVNVASRENQAGQNIAELIGQIRTLNGSIKQTLTKVQTEKEELLSQLTASQNETTIYRTNYEEELNTKDQLVEQNSQKEQQKQKFMQKLTKWITKKTNVSRELKELVQNKELTNKELKTKVTNLTQRLDKSDKSGQLLINGLESLYDEWQADSCSANERKSLINELEKINKNLTSDLEELREKSEISFNSEIAKLNEVKNQKASLQKQVRKWEELVVSLTNENLSEKEKNQLLNNELTHHQQLVEEVNLQNRDLVQNLHNLATKLSQSQQSLTESLDQETVLRSSLEGREQELHKKSRDYQERFTKLNSEKQTLVSQINQLEQEKAQLNDKLNSQLQDLHQQISQSQIKEEEKEKLVKEIDQIQQNKTSTENQLNNQINFFQQKIANLTNISQKDKTDLSEQLNNYQIDLNNLGISNLTNWKREIQTWKTGASRFSSLEEKKEKIEQELTFLKEKLNLNDANFNTWEKTIDEHFAKLKSEKEGRENEANNCEKNITSLQENITNNEQNSEESINLLKSQIEKVKREKVSNEIQFQTEIVTLNQKIISLNTTSHETEKNLLDELEELKIQLENSQQSEKAAKNRENLLEKDIKRLQTDFQKEKDNNEILNKENASFLQQNKVTRQEKDKLLRELEEIKKAGLEREKKLNGLVEELTVKLNDEKKIDRKLEELENDLKKTNQELERQNSLNSRLKEQLKINSQEKKNSVRIMIGDFGYVVSAVVAKKLWDRKKIINKLKSEKESLENSLQTLQESYDNLKLTSDKHKEDYEKEKELRLESEREIVNLKSQIKGKEARIEVLEAEKNTWQTEKENIKVEQAKKIIQELNSSLNLNLSLDSNLSQVIIAIKELIAKPPTIINNTQYRESVQNPLDFLNTVKKEGLQWLKGILSQHLYTIAKEKINNQVFTNYLQLVEIRNGFIEKQLSQSDNKLQLVIRENSSLVKQKNILWLLLAIGLLGIAFLTGKLRTSQIRNKKYAKNKKSNA